MFQFFDLCFLYLSAYLICPADLTAPRTIILMLCAFSLACFRLVLDHPFIQNILSVLCLILGVLFPEFCSFFPFIWYQSFYTRKYLFPVFSVIPLIFLLGLESAVQCFGNIPFLSTISYQSTIQASTTFQSSATIHFLTISLLYMLSFFLSHKSRTLQELKSKVHQLRDNNMERETILEDQNTKILEAQNDKIYIATLQERNRIAREIHDNVGHMLSRSILQVGALLAITKEEPQHSLLENLKSSLDEAMNRVRSSVHDLHNEAIDLNISLQDIVKDFSFCPVSLQCDVSKYMPKEVKYCIISIVSEALNNIIKHSNATKVTITVKEHPGLYQCVIEDNGTVSLKENSPISDGIGLSNMRDRVRQLNGILHFNTENGFRIFISVPKK